jgi:hypothetical protein
LNISVKVPLLCLVLEKEQSVIWVLKLVQPLLHYDDSMGRYLRSTDRSDVADAADKVAEYLTGDEEVYANPELYFDQVIEINLSELEPHLNGPPRFGYANF